MKENMQVNSLNFLASRLMFELNFSKYWVNKFLSQECLISFTISKDNSSEPGHIFELYKLK
ncbi:MAG: hypothetical protein ACJAXX_001029 [Roseivirga sp.]|jgi:hypothetical protein